MNFNGINKAMIFPYSEYMINIVKFNKLLNFDIKSIVSFKSWGYTDKAPLFMDKSGYSKYMVTDDFEGELNKINTVILGSFQRYYGDDEISNKYLGKENLKGDAIDLYSIPSTDMLDFILEIEKRYQVMIPTEKIKIKNFMNIGTILDILENIKSNN